MHTCKNPLKKPCLPPEASGRWHTAQTAWIPAPGPGRKTDSPDDPARWSGTHDRSPGDSPEDSRMRASVPHASRGHPAVSAPFHGPGTSAEGRICPESDSRRSDG